MGNKVEQAKLRSTIPANQLAFVLMHRTRGGGREMMLMCNYNLKKEGW